MATPAAKRTKLQESPERVHSRPQHSDSRRAIRDSRLKDLKEELEAAIAANSLSAQRDALTELARYAPTLQQLKATGVGKTVITLVNSPLQPLAKVLVQMWKTLLPEPTKEKGFVPLPTLPVAAAAAAADGASPLFASPQPPTQNHTATVTQPFPSQLSSDSDVLAPDSQGLSQEGNAAAPADSVPMTLDTSDLEEHSFKRLAERKAESPTGVSTNMHEKLYLALKTADETGRPVSMALDDLRVDFCSSVVVDQIATLPTKKALFEKFRQIMTNLQDVKNGDFRTRVLLQVQPSDRHEATGAYDLVKVMPVTDMANPEKRKEWRDTTEYMRYVRRRLQHACTYTHTPTQGRDAHGLQQGAEHHVDVQVWSLRQVEDDVLPDADTLCR